MTDIEVVEKLNILSGETKDPYYRVSIKYNQETNSMTLTRQYFFRNFRSCEKFEQITFQRALKVIYGSFITKEFKNNKLYTDKENELMDKLLQYIDHEIVIKEKEIEYKILSLKEQYKSLSKAKDNIFGAFRKMKIKKIIKHNNVTLLKED